MVTFLYSGSSDYFCGREFCMIETDHLLTVIVPIYNVEKYLRRCIDSILVQTYGKLEIILVDDGS